MNKQNDNGMTPLHIACEEKNYAAVLQLLKEGAEVNIYNKEGLYPAHIAMLKNDWQTARLLMICGDTSYRDSTMLSEPVQKKLEPFKTQLIQIKEFSDASVNPFEFAIRCNDSNALLLLIQKSPEDFKSAELLHVAVEANNLDAVKVLIEHQPDCIHQLDYQGYNALSIAIKSGHKDIANYLVVAGMKIDSSDNSKSQIQIAIESYDQITFLALLKFGATLSLEDMQSVLQIKELSLAYLDFISDNKPEIRKMLTNPYLSSESVLHFVLLFKDYLDGITPSIREYATQLIQQAIELNETLCESTKLHSKKIALQKSIKGLQSISELLTEKNVSDEKHSDIDAKPNQYAILLVISTWQNILSKPVSYQSKFDMRNHLAFFNIPEPRREVVVDRNEAGGRCVIL